MLIGDFIEKGSFTLKSGEKTDTYVNLKNIVSFPTFHKEVCNKIAERINKECQHICGTPYGAIPFASYISINNNIPMLLLRKEIKKHGTGKILEGKWEKGDKLVLIEDVITTGSSVMNAAQLLEEMGLKVIQIIGVLSRSKEDLKYKDIPITCIYNLHSL